MGRRGERVRREWGTGPLDDPPGLEGPSLQLGLCQQLAVQRTAFPPLLHPSPPSPSPAAGQRSGGERNVAASFGPDRRGEGGRRGTVRGDGQGGRTGEERELPVKVGTTTSRPGRAPSHWGPTEPG